MALIDYSLYNQFDPFGNLIKEEMKEGDICKKCKCIFTKIRPSISNCWCNNEVKDSNFKLEL